MSDHLISGIAAVLIAMAGVAVIAVIVSGGSNTPGVLGSFGTTISNMICTAVSPITGKSCNTLTPSVNSTITFGQIP